MNANQALPGEFFCRLKTWGSAFGSLFHFWRVWLYMKNEKTKVSIEWSYTEHAYILIENLSFYTNENSGLDI